MIRRPTDRAQAWESWRRRVAGETLPIAMDEPQCGFYRAKRFGQHVGVQIDLWQEVDPDTGELTAPERMVAFIGGDTFFDDHVYDIWIRCGGSPISEAEFERLERMPAVSDLTRQVIV